MAEKAQEEAEAEAAMEASAVYSNADLNKDPFHVPQENAIVKYGKNSR